MVVQLKMDILENPNGVHREHENMQKNIKVKKEYVL